MRGEPLYDFTALRYWEDSEVSMFGSGGLLESGIRYYVFAITILGSRKENCSGSMGC